MTAARCPDESFRDGSNVITLPAGCSARRFSRLSAIPSVLREGSGEKRSKHPLCSTWRH
jgi:hypothetical protein